MTKKQKEGLVGITTGEFNEARQKQFDETVYVVSKKIVSEINTRLKDFGKLSYEDVCSRLSIDVKGLVPGAITSEGNIFAYDFIRHFDAQDEVGSKRYILFNAIWDAVRSKFEGWDIEYQFGNSLTNSELRLNAHFNPKKMITAKDFGNMWETERNKMIQFCKDAISKGIAGACGKRSIDNCEIRINHIVYDYEFIMTPAEGINAYNEVRDEFIKLGWYVQIFCKKESLKNNLYPNRIYSIVIKPAE